MIGKTISHYKILEKLGGGGMGVVYKAKDTKLKRTVALKFLPPDLTRDDEAKERFMLEAQAASALDHPNICTIYEIDETKDGQLFIAMACYQGETLKQRLESVGANGRSPLPVAEAIEIVIQIAHGLAKAHEQGIVHRDIKPANIMVTTDGIVKILDFGLAKLTGATQLTKSGTTLGTVAYMSPEQATGVSVDHRTDLWSLGVVLYEMLAGQLPFKAEYEQAVVYSILNEDLEPIANLPEELEQIVQKALQKEPSERYQSAEEMLSDLQAFREGTKPTVAKTRTRFPQRKRVYFFGGLAALIVSILIGFFILWPSKPSPVEKIRLAVLPFDNITGNPDDEYFADGITDEMISKLSKIAGFGVIARTSVMHYKKAPKTIAEIGRELRVTKILEGSVRKAADQLRITVQLVDVATQVPIWSDDYNRQLADVFAIQSEVAQQVASALRVELSTGETRHINKKWTDNLEAYNLYLNGRFYWSKRNPTGLNKSIEYFQRALKIEPNYALAYAGQADSYNVMASFAITRPIDMYAKAKAAATHAIEIDDELAEAYASLAYARMRLDWDWAGAEKALKRAIALKPGYAFAHLWYGFLLQTLDRFDESVKELEKARELDPLSPGIHVAIAGVLYTAGQYDQALEILLNTVEMAPNSFSAYLYLSFVYPQKGMYEQGIAASKKAMKLSGGHPTAVALLGLNYAMSGQTDAALKILDDLNALSAKIYVSPFFIAGIHAMVGNDDQFFEWMEKALEMRSPYLQFLKGLPYPVGLRSDPRFTGLLRKIGLEQ